MCLSRTLPVLMMEGVGWILFRKRQESLRRGVLKFQVPEKKKVKLNSYASRYLNGNCWLESKGEWRKGARTDVAVTGL